MEVEGETKMHSLYKDSGKLNRKVTQTVAMDATAVAAGLTDYSSVLAGETVLATALALPVHLPKLAGGGTPSLGTLLPKGSTSILVLGRNLL